MDIEDRAGKWLDEAYPDGGSACGPFAFDSSDMIAAYLAGSAQTQADYTAPQPPTGAPCERHDEIGCAWCIP